jgi:hypothetical protein
VSPTKSSTSSTSWESRLTSSAEFRIFTAAVLFVGAITVGFIALDIYLHPPGHEEVGTATIHISGEGRFSGIVGTDSTNYTIEATSPATVKVPYSLEDYVVADVKQDSGAVEIRVNKETVEKGANTMLVWKPPRSGS